MQGVTRTCALHTRGAPAGSQCAPTAVVAAVAGRAYKDATPATSRPSAESSAPSHWERRYLVRAFIGVMYDHAQSGSDHDLVKIASGSRQDLIKIPSGSDWRLMTSPAE